MKSSPSSNYGFTLTELMLVVAVAGVLAMLAMPGFTSLSQSQRVKNASFELYAALSVARSEAIKRNSNVTIIFQNHSVDFPKPTHNEVSWVITAADGTTIRNKDLIKGVSITPAGLAGMQIVYGRNGRPTLTANAATFQIDAAGVSTPTQYIRCITIELNGMPRIRQGACT